VVEYEPARCLYCKAKTWCELRSNKRWQCRACKIERFFSRILFPPLSLVLLPWQKKVLRDLYGTVKPEDGSRQYTSAYISVAKKNGKSFLIGGLPIYHLCMEDEENPEAYGGAAAKEQAGIVFKSARKLVEANPDLLARLKVLPSTKRIIKRNGNGFYAVLSADGDLQDGIEPSLSIRDEVHRWKNARAETLYDVMTKGQISRVDPLDIAITTAGAEYESPLWFREYESAKRILEGSLSMPDRYVAIWEADVKRLEAEPEYWKSRAARVAANPSHEDCGGFLQDTAIVRELDKALAQPADREKYLRYHLNLPLTTEEQPVIDMTKWTACGGDVDLRAWPEYDYEFLIQKWNLQDKLCYAGVDASWTTDLTSVVFIFPPFGAVPQWTLLPFFWVPSEKADDLQRICRVPFRHWIETHFVSETSGAVIDQRAVVERIRWGHKVFNLREVPYDRFNFRSEALNLRDEGFEAVEIQQSYLHLSQPTKFLLGLYLDGKLRHANNPVLNWMAACLQLQYDHKDNCQPSKPERGKSSKRIDGIQATVTGLSRAMIFETDKISYSGIRSVG